MPDPQATPDPQDYALAPALRARVLGVGLIAVAVPVVLGAVLAALTPLTSGVVTGLAALSIIGVLVLGALVGVRRWVVRLTDDGYQVRGLRAAGARSARWAEVKDVQAVTRSGARCVELRLRDGRATTIPADVLEGGAQAFADAVAARLDRGHGYRRLR